MEIPCNSKEFQFQLGTIHLKRQQIFKIFDTNPLPLANLATFRPPPLRRLKWMVLYDIFLTVEVKILMKTLDVQIYVLGMWYIHKY